MLTMLSHMIMLSMIISSKEIVGLMCFVFFKTIFVGLMFHKTIYSPPCLCVVPGWTDLTLRLSLSTLSLVSSLDPACWYVYSSSPPFPA